MAMNPAAAFPVTDGTQVAEPRRVAQWLAMQVGLSEERGGSAALIVTELATNLAKHARDGEVLLRRVTDGDGRAEAVEVIALDRGPGIPDVALSQRDGYSTSGTLGHGLGAIERQADAFELFTHATGTVIAARVYRDKPPDGRRLHRLQVGAVNVCKPGEAVCGDAWDWRLRQGRLSVVVADGLGHGALAHDAAAAAVAQYASDHEARPSAAVDGIHRSLRGTRGAAVAVAAVDLERETVTYAGIGNIAGAVLLPSGGRHNMVSHNGTAGHTAARIQEFQYPMTRGSMLVIASDGLSTHWDLDAYPGLRARSSSIVAAVLYRDFSRRRDDVTVVVAKERPGVSEKL